jgi:hypothetical protein
MSNGKFTDHKPALKSSALGKVGFLLIGLIAFGGCVAMKRLSEPAKTSPVLEAVAEKGGIMMKVLGRCRLGESYASVSSHFSGSSKVATFRVGEKRMTVHVKWPSGDEFGGSFEDGKLVWASEVVSWKASQGEVVESGFLNSSSPVEPARITTVKGGMKVSSLRSWEVSPTGRNSF